MRFIPILFLALFFAVSAQAQKMAPLKVSWKFENVEPGYDHKNKCVVYVDGEEVAESSATLQTKPNTMKLEVPAGKHVIRVVNFALYEGVWEEHTVENNYSLDCVFEEEVKFSKKGRAISMVFDLDGEVVSKVK